MSHPTPDPRRILLVEDSRNDAELALLALAEDRLADVVDVVRDGAEALDYLTGQGAHAGRPAPRPAVVLLDLKLPKLDGLEVLQRLKADPELRAIPVVMLSSSREERDLARSYALGANAYVVKPVEFSAYLAAMRGVGRFWAVVNQPPG